MKIQSLGSSCLVLLLVLNGCFPGSIRNQEKASDPIIQCEEFRIRPDSTAFILQHPDQHYEVLLKEEEGAGPIEIIVSISSRLGDKFRVDNDKIRFKFEFNDWTESQAELVSVEEIDWSSAHQRDLAKARPEPRFEIKAFQQDHQFQVSGDYNRNHVLLKASMALYKRDFEVKIPSIQIGEERIPARVFKYKWNNRWVASESSGC